MKRFSEWVKEEAVPANAVGGGKVAGVGVGSQGEPGMDPKKQKAWRRKNGRPKE